ncbi:MAG TPA: patatin-like phospholipase family protein [Nitrospiraceae bacterium]|nr:patatin-like phospholipase family protein [Nitrospiraceae bacterium]
MTGNSVTTSKMTTGLVLLAILISGCAHYPINPKLEKYEPPRLTMGAMVNSPTRSDDLLLVVSFSGGGTRAAALGYGVLEALAEIDVPALSNSPNAASGTRHHLAQEVDLATGVSGGSIVAAYFALHGDGIFTDFRENFLYRNVTWGLIGRLLNPVNMIRVASAYFSKSDLEAEYLDDHLFHEATFKDIDPRKGPGLVIQATDITDGNYFTFSPLQFGLICSDLAAFPLARATAASSSVPGPLGAITLRNYAGQCGFQEEEWMTRALASGDFRSRAYRFAMQAQAYRNWNDKPFIHLVDGVVSDNLGVRGYLDLFMAHDDVATVLKSRGLEHVRRVAFIIVNAETKHSTSHWSLLEEDPGITDVGDVALTAMINNYTFESTALLRQMVREWSAHRQATQPGGKPLDYYVVEVTFKGLPDANERQGFLDLPTSFDLPDTDVDRLREVGKRILYSRPEFQKLVRDLGGNIPGSLATVSDSPR